MDAHYSTPRLGQPTTPATAPATDSRPPPHPHHPAHTPPRKEQVFHEKLALDLVSSARPPLPSSSSLPPPYHPRSPCPYSSRPSPSPYSRTAPAYSRPRHLLIASLLRPWTPIILYAITTLGFLAAIGFWRDEVFEALDELSRWLKADEYVGYAAIFMLIFLTTFPPVPLYSTLVVLSGYTFGTWTGLVISYAASLAGALTVFLLSRAFFRECISRWLSCTLTIKRVVRAIEKRPKLLFLIRLAPYPYNVMNCLLAASPTLTLRTYTVCTALSLFKLIIHTSIGASIRSFAQYHVVKPGQADVPAEDNMLGHYSTVVGIALCVAIFVYLSYVARRAVDDELEDDPYSARDSEETASFLAHQEGEMEEVPTTRPPSRVDDRFIYAGREEASIGL